jgi:hypothetical protein
LWSAALHPTPPGESQADGASEGQWSHHFRDGRWLDAKVWGQSSYGAKKMHRAVSATLD